MYIVSLRSVKWYAFNNSKVNCSFVSWCGFLKHNKWSCVSH